MHHHNLPEMNKLESKYKTKQIDDSENSMDFNDKIYRRKQQTRQ